MKTLLVSTWELPAARALADAARDARWRAVCAADRPSIARNEKVAYYGGADVAMAIAARFGLVLLEPSWELLATLSFEFTRRNVEYAQFKDLSRIATAAFVKPADPLDKAFDAGVYASSACIRAPRGIHSETPVLVSEPVEWLAEHRCFVLEGRLVAWSSYLSFGRPAWKPFSRTGPEPCPPDALVAFCDRLAQSGVALPPAFVMDVGWIEDRGWAIVEFNPAWCSSVLGAAPRKVLGVLDRACQRRDAIREGDRRWVLDRPRATT